MTSHIQFQALVFLLCLTSAPAADKPNVVILFTDDQGTLDANCYGSKDLYSPNIDKLAETGVRFTQAYAHTVCCPSRAMLLTGRHPQRSGIVNWTQGSPNMKRGINLPLEEITLAESLQAAGYATGLFGKWHLGADFNHGPIKQGFDEFIGLRGGFIDNYNHYFLHGKGFHDLYEGTTEIFARDQYFPDMITARALAFIEENKNENKPFFAFVSFNIPHYPEQADSKFDERYQKLAEPRRSYAKMISTVDERVGRILDYLEKHDLRDNTIVIFMSDNGHSIENVAIRFDEHNSGLAKGTNYGANGGGGNTGKWLGRKKLFLEGGIRVPAIISYPAKLPQDVVRDQAVTAMDWMPTILELCGAPLPEVTLDGASILPIIRDASAGSHNKTMHWAWRGTWAVRQGDWKLLGTGKKVTSLVKLSDPNPEAIDYQEAHPDRVAELLQLHQVWLREVTR